MTTIHELAKHFFGFGEDPKTIKIILPSISQKRAVSLKCANYPLYKYEISPDDMLSAFRIHSLLTGIYGEVVEILSHNDIALKPNQNLIFIGGPPTNVFSYQAVEDAPIRFGNNNVDRVIITRNKDYKIGFSSTNKHSRSIIEDYTFISKRKKNKHVEFVIGGLRAYGQVAVYNFFNEEKFYREVIDISRSNSFQILVQIIVSGKACVDWKVVEKEVWVPNISNSSMIRYKREKGEFDVFLCHNSEDKTVVKEIGEKLRKRGILPWLDEWEIKPGKNWMEELQKQFKYIKSAAIFIGKNGIGPWQKQEIMAFIREFVKRNCPVIPVILSDCEVEPELPIFLEGNQNVDFRNKTREPLEELIKGIPTEQA